jgi:hypothetical protein
MVRIECHCRGLQHVFANSPSQEYIKEWKQARQVSFAASRSFTTTRRVTNLNKLKKDNSAVVGTDGIQQSAPIPTVFKRFAKVASKLNCLRNGSTDSDSDEQSIARKPRKLRRPRLRRETKAHSLT